MQFDWLRLHIQAFVLKPIPVSAGKCLHNHGVINTWLAEISVLGLVPDWACRDRSWSSFCLSGVSSFSPSSHRALQVSKLVSSAVLIGWIIYTCFFAISVLVKTLTSAWLYYCVLWRCLDLWHGWTNKNCPLLLSTITWLLSTQAFVQPEFTVNFCFQPEW